MSESKEILTMRAMAWQRAKGELLSVLDTYWPGEYRNGRQQDNGFELANKKIQAFLEDFEENCR